MRLVGVTLLVALSDFLFADAQAQQTPPQIVDATDLFLLGFNLARTARMDSQVPLLMASEALENEAASVLAQLFTDKEDCESSDDDFTPVKLQGYYEPSRYFDERQGEDWGKKAVQDELNHAMPELKATPPEGQAYNPDKKPFTNEAVQNLAYLMYPQSTEVGCARTADCEGPVTYILCRFSPTLVAGKSVPFPSDVYESLLARNRYNVWLTTLSAVDVETRLSPLAAPGGGGAAGGGAAGGESAASFAFPGVGLLVFTAMGMLIF
ncbi:hypothetical protein Emed_003301 [Eimeria media]